MSALHLYIAQSLDGFIARPDGNLDWLISTPNPMVGDYGYADLLGRTEANIMGRETYEEVLKLSPEWMYPNLQTYVVTTNARYQAKTPNTQVWSDQIAERIRHLKTTAKRDIWLIGGGQVIAYCLDHDLVDSMLITLIPIVLGEGIRLFPRQVPASHWTLVNVQSFHTGLVNVTYARRRNE